MALVPDPMWRVPAKTWNAVIDRYVHFRRVKGWHGRPYDEDGHVLRNRLTAKQGSSLRKRLKKEVSRFVADGQLPKSPYPLRQATIDKLLECFGCKSEMYFDDAPSAVKDLWKALVFNSWCYTCSYCHRTVWGTYKELGATIRFELDHRRAKARLKELRRDFSTGNIRLACRSCNLIKGQMTRYAFLKELRSFRDALANARIPLWLNKKNLKRSNDAVHLTGAHVSRSGR